MSHAEFLFLKSILAKYFEHLKSNPDSLITKYIFIFFIIFYFFKEF